MLDGYIKNRAIIARVINGDEIFNICKVPAATSVSSRLLAFRDNDDDDDDDDDDDVFSACLRG